MAAIVVALVPAVPTLSAHPHMFLESRVDLVFCGNEISEAVLEWTFDRFFTESIVLDYDHDGNRRLDAQESSTVYDSAFINLANYGFFTHVTANGDTWQPSEVSDFRAQIVDDRLQYRFTIPIDVVIPPGVEMEVTLAVYDETFFCDCRIPQDGVRAEGRSPVPWSYAVGTDRSTIISYDPRAGLGSYGILQRNGIAYGGTAHPQQITINFNGEQ